VGGVISISSTGVSERASALGHLIFTWRSHFFYLGKGSPRVALPSHSISRLPPWPRCKCVYMYMSASGHKPDKHNRFVL